MCVTLGPVGGRSRGLSAALAGADAGKCKGNQAKEREELLRSDPHRRQVHVAAPIVSTDGGALGEKDFGLHSLSP